MTELLINNPLLLLFTVASAGYLIGSIKIRGYQLGVAAVLFVGLFVGALNPKFNIPDIVFSLGLVLFVYSIGLSSGAAFFESYRKKGFRDFAFIIAMLCASGIIAILVAMVMGFDAATITGIYAGSTTNTPALAGVIDYINAVNDPAQLKTISQNLVVGYSYSYPMGVMGGIIGIILMEKFLKINYGQEKKSLKNEYPVGDGLTSITILVENEQALNVQLRDLYKQENWNVNFGRISQKGNIGLSNFDQTFELGDQILAVGDPEELEKVTSFLGRVSEEKLSYYRHKYDSRRIFVSNPRLIGRTISSLNLHQKFSAIITRIRRGDVDMLARGNTVLEQGDRVRFVARREDLNALSKYFGDSYQQASTVNIFSFGLGIGIGLILGSINIPISNTLNFNLGIAGGPLIVGLILGALRRTGPITWTLPFGANVILQQIGLMMLLASIGVSSGHSFIDSLGKEAFLIIAASGIISMTTAIMTIVIGYKLVKIPFSLLMGMVSNQPAILDFAVNRSGTALPKYGYSMMFPIALIAKILIAQLLYIYLT